MTREPRVVIDTNVLVSFFLRRGSTPWRVVRDALECGELLVSDDTIAELEEGLRRPKFDRYVSRALREEFLVTLPRFATRVAITERIKACRDPRDDKFLEAAVNGQAAFLVTGDRALLAMRTFRSVVIISPSGRAVISESRLAQNTVPGRAGHGRCYHRCLVSQSGAM